MLKKILCPVDFSKGSEHAISMAEELARNLRAEIELFHAYQLPVLALPDSTVTVSPTFVADMTDRAQRALNNYRDAVAAHDIPVSTRLVEGNPSDAVVERAREVPTYMIVMGTHGRSGFRRFLLGSTAERVVRTATVPVLTVHLPEA
jgi:nucleotide-binding universal stress UspA family protein